MKYTTKEGKEYEFLDSIFAHPPTWEKGVAYMVRISYDIQNEQAMLLRYDIVAPTITLDIKKMIEMTDTERKNWIANRIHQDLQKRFSECTLEYQKKTTFDG